MNKLCYQVDSALSKRIESRYTFVIDPGHGGRDNGTTGYVEFEPEEFTIVSGGAKDLSFKVERGAYTQNANFQKAFDMVLTFKFL